MASTVPLARVPSTVPVTWVASAVPVARVALDELECPKTAADMRCLGP